MLTRILCTFLKLKKGKYVKNITRILPSFLSTYLVHYTFDNVLYGGKWTFFLSHSVHVTLLMLAGLCHPSGNSFIPLDRNLLSKKMAPLLNG